MRLAQLSMDNSQRIMQLQVDTARALFEESVNNARAVHQIIIRSNVPAGEVTLPVTVANPEESETRGEPFDFHEEEHAEEG